MIVLKCRFYYSAVARSTDQDSVVSETRVIYSQFPSPGLEEPCGEAPQSGGRGEGGQEPLRWFPRRNMRGSVSRFRTG